MGTRIPPPIIVPASLPGDPCNVCWGPGKPFGDDDTPEIIVVTVSGVNKSDNWVAADGDPVNGVFELQQSSAVPCVFEFDEDFISLGCLFDPDFTNLQVSNPQGRSTFSGETDSGCELELVNETSDHFTGGTAVITIPEVQS